MEEAKEVIAGLLSKHIGMKKEEILRLIETPPSADMGDYAFPCFALAKEMKKSPVDIAAELADSIKPINEIPEIKAAGPYLNFFLDKKTLAEEVVNQILKEKDEFGSGNKKKEKVVIEFLSPNTNKPLHLGHLRNMAIGESISRIIEKLGSKVARVNLYNDRGIHICKSMLAYKKYGKGKKPGKKQKPDHFVGDFYVMFNEKLKENPNLEEESQKLLQKWEEGDKETLALWKKMNDLVRKGIKETYTRFGIGFDKNYYESQIYKKGKEIIEEGLKKGIFTKREDNAVIINLEKEGFGEKVLLRPDGTAIYITQDLYLAKLKYEDFYFDKSIYVVANEQDYHFKVLFKTLELLGYNFAKKCMHLSYGMVFLPEGRMKSREGKIVDADDLIDEMQKLANNELKKRYKLTKNELDKRSLRIALSAIKYFLLKIEAVKDVTFNPEESINFEGDTGPYLQYSYARASSILKKAKIDESKIKQIKATSLEFHEVELVKKLALFSGVVQNAYRQLNPSVIANYAFQLAQQFNEFYHACPVIASEKETQKQRLALVQSFRIVMKNALWLLGIEAIEEM